MDWKNVKEFLKPDWRKIVVFLVLTALAFVLILWFSWFARPIFSYDIFHGCCQDGNLADCTRDRISVLTFGRTAWEFCMQYHSDVRESTEGGMIWKCCIEGDTDVCDFIGNPTSEDCAEYEQLEQEINREIKIQNIISAIGLAVGLFILYAISCSIVRFYDKVKKK